ncbi:UNVERIFIED_CONTAM: hypothetical protein PYX00_011794 [Menopon gallinae]|uniref:Rad50/SbcC-type AAA domain-containing protein n=1 Tax=Menopon gallinae TaxID=328185 RepID=A0AAW2H8Q2_9NEOP
MEARTPSGGRRLSLADCTELCFLGAPSYTYLHADTQRGTGEKRAFVFLDKELRIPALPDSFSVSDQTSRAYTSLFVLPRCILLSKKKHHTLVPGFSFRTPEPLRKALMLGDQLVCVTGRAIYFMPGHVVETDFVDTDHTPQELFVLRDRTVEIYSSRREVFSINVDSAQRIRCTMSPRTVVLATGHDVFLVDLVRGATRHLASTDARITDVVYDSSTPAACGGGVAPDVCTSIRDEETLRRALETGAPAGGPELLYVQCGTRLTLLYIQTLRARSISLPFPFRLCVSRSHVILTHKNTLVFLSKCLTRFCDAQADFCAFGCRSDVLAFAKDDLTIINGGRFVFRMGGGWEYTSRLFRMAGYHELRRAYTREDYDDYPLGSAGAEDARFVDALAHRVHGGTCAGGGYLEQLARGRLRGKKGPKRMQRTRRGPLKRVVEELKDDLRILEMQCDDALLGLELARPCAPEAAGGADAPAPSGSALFALAREDYHDLYVGRASGAAESDSGRLATRRYSPSSQRRRGFIPSAPGTVEFHPPLTIIVGQNGSGKTTIIEALKYAATGNMPPNTKGGAFIYDPKLAREVEVKAQIKLKFHNTRGQLMVCTRSLQLTQKKTKVEQKTLESVLWTLNERGEQVSISGRCAEIDREVPHHLGVSPAILESVVFCHQEESTWPLGEPGVVKRKMDDIFESAKYTKALQALKTLRRDQHAELRLKRQALGFLDEQRGRKAALEARVAETERLIADVDERAARVGHELEQWCVDCERVGSEIAALEAAAARAREVQAEIRGLGLFVRDFGWPVLSGEEARELEGVDRASLQAAAQELRDKAERDQGELEARTREREAWLDTQDVHRRLELQLSEGTARLRALAADSGTCFTAYTQFVEKYSALLGIEGLRSDCARVMEAAPRTDDGDEEQLASSIALCCRSLRNIADAVLRQLEARAAEAADEARQQRELHREHAARRGRIELELEYLEKKARGTDAAQGGGACAEIAACVREIARRQVLIDSMCSPATGCARRSAADLGAALCAEHPHLLDAEGRLCPEAFEAEYEKTAREVERLRAAQEGAGCAIRFHMERLRVQLERIGAVSARHGLAGNTAPVPRIDVTDLRRELEKLSTDIVSSSNASVIYRNLQKLGVKKNSCPVCKKPFSGGEKGAFIDRLEEVVGAIPRIIEELKRKKDAVEKSLGEAERANTVRDERNAEVRRLNECLDAMRPLAQFRSVEELRRVVGGSCGACPELAAGERHLRRVLGGMRIANAMRAAQLCDAAAGLRAEVDALGARLDALAGSALKENAQNTRQPADGPVAAERVRQLEAEREEAGVQATRCEEAARLAGERERELRAHVESAWKESFAVSRDAAAIRDGVAATVARNGELRAAVVAAAAAPCAVDARCIDELRLRAQRSWDSYHRQREAAGELEMRLRALDENRKLADAKRRLAELESEYDGTVFGRLDELRARAEGLDARRREAENRRAALAGERTQLGRSRDQHVQELETAFRDCDAKHGRAVVELRTAEAALDDVEAGIGAIDKSIVDFHSRMLEEVNTTLRDLWTTTYRGNDIDYIEVQADTSESRSYSYRVVMVKNGCELDMRSRSSAGQKVIASILVRLALAETFASSCSFMALDEPTTNLDQENIESLAATLCSLIERKRESSKFQLIVITHDEHFVRLLCGSCDMYYKLRRNARGDSVVEKQFV